MQHRIVFLSLAIFLNGCLSSFSPELRKTKQSPDVQIGLDQERLHEWSMAEILKEEGVEEWKEGDHDIFLAEDDSIFAYSTENKELDKRSDEDDESGDEDESDDDSGNSDNNTPAPVLIKATTQQARAGTTTASLLSTSTAPLPKSTPPQAKNTAPQYTSTAQPSNTMASLSSSSAQQSNSTALLNSRTVQQSNISTPPAIVNINSNSTWTKATLPPTQTPSANITSPPASTTTKTVANSPVMCYQCGDAATPCSAFELLMGQPQLCPLGTSYCMVDIVQRSGVREIRKRCVDEATCEQLWYDQTSDEDRCIKFDPRDTGSQVDCHFCCITDNCNKAVKPDETSWYKP